MPSKSVCLLVGNEEFLKEEWISAARQKIFKDEQPAAAEVDFGLMNAADVRDLAAVFDTAKTIPFLSKKRLLVLKNIDELFDSKPAQEQLLNYVRSPSPNTILILDTDIKEKDFPPNKFFEQLSGLAYVKTFKKIYDTDLINWIAGRFAARKKKADFPALELIKQLKGNDLRAIDQEIEKLCVYAGHRASIAREDVQQLVGKDILSGVDEIIYAISQGDKKRMLEASFDFQNLNKKDFGGAAGLFCWQLRRLLRAKGMIKEGRSQKKIVGDLKVWNKDIEKFMLQCRKLKALWIKKAVKEITEFDLRVKTSGQPDVFLDWQALLLRLFALASL
ncbi:MAG: DNA polymerase III subunit delta [Candidatus Omnitrophica bacterium]|nr:DNA polymerase III subunit delta [Candidatus Omnitrophota bacterium]